MSEPSLKKSTVDKAAIQKILRSLPYENGFHFFKSNSKYPGETAISLFGFLEEFRIIEPSSVRLHFQHHDFQNWIRDTLGDKELADQIDKIDSNLSDQNLKEAVLETAQTRFIELQMISNTLSEQTAWEELKKYSLEELKQYEGQEGKPVYIAFNGKVYDVSSSGSWSGGAHKAAHKAGKDLTQDILSAPHGEEVFSKVKQVGVIIQ